MVSPKVQVWHDQDRRAIAYCCVLDGLHWMDVPGLATFFFDRHGEEVNAIPHPTVAPGLLHDAYRHFVLPMVLHALDTEVLHASAVVARRGVVALCAESATGKSTIAFGLSLRGYPLWADDAVAFDTSGSNVSSIRLPFETRLRPDAEEFFRNHSQTLPPRSLRRGSTDSHDEALPLAALVVLRRILPGSHGAPVKMAELLPTQALAALLAHAYCFSMQEMERKRRMVINYLQLTAKVPVFEVCFQSGLERLSAIIEAIERTAGVTRAG